MTITNNTQSITTIGYYNIGGGRTIDGTEGMRAAEFAPEADLGWTVSSRPLNTLDGAGAMALDCPGWQAIVRDDNDAVLGITKLRFHHLQNHEMLAVCANANPIHHG